ncbi:MAG: N-acetylmuramoyl-L-alanine amidase, partial [Bacteroidota bacterium]
GHFIYFKRVGDEFVELNERAGIANRSKADLFICIHCNSGAPEAYGPETYVMGLHKTADNLNVARRENSSILFEKDYKTKYDGFDPGSPEANIIFTLFQNAFMNQSISFASKIQNEFEEYAGRNNRGVKQAGFLVLYRTTMPSVLIETGFLTNKNEEKYLLSDKGQADIATSIFKAFKEYKIDMEGEPDQEPEAKTQTQPVPPTAKNASSETPKRDSVAQPEKKNKKPKEVEPEKKEELKKEESKTTAEDVEKKISTKDSMISSVPIPEKDAPITDKIIGEIAPVKSSHIEVSGIFYTIQIGATPEATKTVLEKYRDVEGLKSIPGEDGMVRFTVGNFQEINQAINFQTVMRGKGFKDAFVTAYHNNKRITLKEALKLLSKGTESEKKN